MKKAYFFHVVSLIFVIIAASCTTPPESQRVDSPVRETSGNDTQPVIAASEPKAADIQTEPIEAPVEEILDLADDADGIAAEPGQEEPVTAETLIIKEPDLAEAVEEDAVLAEEPEQLALAEPEPIERPLRAFEQPSQTEWMSPPLPVVPPESPPPAAMPVPPAVTPAPPPQSAEAPPEEQEAPVIAREPLPLNVPELPSPTTDAGGWQDENAIVPMVFSRVVRATVGQVVEVPFRGTGWVYLGEAGAQRGIAYDSRRLDPDGQSFIFKTERAGEYALKFYRQDFIRDFILNDYVQVIVGAPQETAGTGWFGPSVDRGRVVAEPRWPSSLEEARSRRAENNPSRSEIPPVAETAPPLAQSPAQNNAPTAAAPVQSAAPTQPAIQTPTAPPAQPSAPPEAAVELLPDLGPEGYIQKAREEFEAGRIAAAINVLDQFLQRYPIGSDEALWFLGQYYEANSPSRNILASLDCYRRLVQEYPQSNRYDDARRRIAYLQRYYININ
ncbi:MAG: hypothetical protein LBG95_03825 [Treponema sp.]|nr:hypothetical protein [Treponema sp.]